MFIISLVCLHQEKNYRINSIVLFYTSAIYSSSFKNKVTYYGNIYQKHVKNPIRQVKRQIYLLSTYLKQNGIKIWVEGYVFLVENNSPVTSEYVLHARSDIDRAIHSKANRKISRQDVERIVSLLSMNGFQY